MVVSNIPEGIPKSGRIWKIKQTSRSSSQFRKGISSHLCKTFEDKLIEKQRKLDVKELEKSMVAETKRKHQEVKEKREEKKKLRTENEFKNVSYQMLKPEKMKSMSKKQLRAVKKTSVNKDGKVELISPWGSTNQKSKTK